MISRDGTKLIATVPAGEQVVGMVMHNGQVFVATSSGVYRYDCSSDSLVPIMFLPAPKEGTQQ